MQFTYFNFEYNNDKSHVVSTNIPSGLGKILFNIASAYTYSINNDKKLAFKQQNDNISKKLFTSFFNNKLNIIDNEIEFKTLENNNCIIQKNDNNNIYLNGLYNSFIYLNSNDNSTRNFLRHLVYSNDNYMYSSYDIYNSIKSYFTKLNEKECLDDDLISLHIKVNYDINILYYNKALDLTDKSNVVIFSNNIEWCKKNKNKFNYKNKTLYFLDINIMEIEFILLTMIKHNIVSESHFSLMASYISYYETKKTIIAPSSTISFHEDITNVI
tara:strand:+ start:2592 stop:3404 length:813 start_codon:yes stop_codon:yes gene_type:complete